jgi:hypothetical protein
MSSNAVTMDVAQANTPRQPLANHAAERIAASADRLESQAAQVRPKEKQLALQLLREATKLRQYARDLEIQHKRAIRVMMGRLRAARAT